MEGFLKLEPIWEDESLLEIRISATNGKFSGETECYTSRAEIAELGSALNGFPVSPDSKVEFKTGGNPNLSFFSLNFYCADSLGHVSVRVRINHNENYSSDEIERYSVEFDLRVEPSHIDRFVTLLDQVVKEELGSVTAELGDEKS